MTIHYRIDQGHFYLSKAEWYEQALYDRKKVPKEISDETFVRIEEMVEGNRVVRRIITAYQTPGKNSSEAEIVFDEPVDEAWGNDR